MAAKFGYVDLFAGIGGFHAALSALGGECRFVSEIDEDAARVYAFNWGAEVVPLNPEDPDEPVVHGDIREFAPEDGPVTVPDHDILAAGFPCQPFSKSGAQMGVRDRTRGTLFYNILRILEARKPKVVFLENVRNLAGPRHQETWDVIIESLRDLGYRVPSEPTVLSPHLLNPRLGGSPQVRDRVFILAVHVGKARAKEESKGLPASIPRRPVEIDPNEWSLANTSLPWNRSTPVLLDDSATPEAKKYFLGDAENRWIDAWDDFVRRMLRTRGKPLPGFPLWAEDWRPREELDAWVENHASEWAATPRWKQVFLQKNADFFSEKDAEREIDVEREITAWLSHWFPYWATGRSERERWTSVRLDKGEDLSTGVYFPASRRKLEWQAQHAASLREGVLHLRPSGIRVKRPTYVPALVAITQTSILPSRGRRLMPREGTRLQGLPDWFEFRYLKDGRVRDQPDAASYKQLGNGVAAGAIYYALRKFLLDNREDLTPALQEVARNAPETPKFRTPRLISGTVDLSMPTVRVGLSPMADPATVEPPVPLALRSA